MAREGIFVCAGRSSGTEKHLRQQMRSPARAAKIRTGSTKKGKRHPRSGISPLGALVVVALWMVGLAGFLFGPQNITNLLLTGAVKGFYLTFRLCVPCGFDGW